MIFSNVIVSYKKCENQRYRFKYVLFGHEKPQKQNMSLNRGIYVQKYNNN